MNIIKLACIGLLAILVSCSSPNEGNLKFAISFSKMVSNQKLDGRLLLMISNSDEGEPRFQINDGPNTQMIYGVDVDQMQPGKQILIDGSVFGYPVESVNSIPAGEYYVQALLHTYETFNLSTGHTVKLPKDNGEGQRWNRSPGNLYSTPTKVSIDPQSNGSISITMDQIIPPIEEPEDTEYIKHIKIQSDLLSKFYGRPMFLGAHVLLPEGFDENPNARYPLMVFHGHFPADFGGFRTEPPDPDLKPEHSDRFDLDGYNIIQQEEAYKFYQTWTSKDFPRVLIIKVQHQNPYYDDSYAVNSANLGPYGDAITYELIPHIEEQFRGIGEGWARFLYGGSTGGWEALGVQVKYPDEYNGCFAACPDPIDFRAYMTTNIYEDKNAYYYSSNYKKVLRPGRRDYLGHVTASIKDMNHKELALGTKSRSGQQFDIWEAVYSPQGDDGYPQRLWDKYTGEINQDVAAYWKDNYDLRHILERDWASLGPKLQGKINIYCGDMDNYYLNNAVYLMEEFLEATTDPYYDGEVDYGDRAEHCWNGDHENSNGISRLRYNTMYMGKIIKRIEESAPEGADLTSWRY